MSKILLVAGHGAGDPGATAHSGKHEADVMRKFVKALASKYKEYSVDVDVHDVNKDLYQETNAGRGVYSIPTNKYAQVIECHFNAFNGNANGYETLLLTGLNPDSIDNAIHNSIKKFFNTDRGIKKEQLLNADVFYRKHNTTSYRLIELGFQDNASDEKIFNDNFNKIILSIVEATYKNFGGKKPAVKKTNVHVLKNKHGLHYISYNDFDSNKRPEIVLQHQKDLVNVNGDKTYLLTATKNVNTYSDKALTKKDGTLKVGSSEITQHSHMLED